MKIKTNWFLWQKCSSYINDLDQNKENGKHIHNDDITIVFYWWGPLCCEIIYALHCWLQMIVFQCCCGLWFFSWLSLSYCPPLEMLAFCVFNCTYFHCCVFSIYSNPYPTNTFHCLVCGVSHKTWQIFGNQSLPRFLKCWLWVANVLFHPLLPFPTLFLVFIFIFFLFQELTLVLFNFISIFSQGNPLGFIFILIIFLCQEPLVWCSSL